MSHAQLEENTNDPGPNNYVLNEKKPLSISANNIWKIVSGILFITIIFLALGLCGVFDGSSSSSSDSTMAESTVSLDVSSETESQGSDYLTGSHPPNMLFLLADDIGWADVSINGGRFNTPHIDELLSSGVQFTNFYSQALCTPSRMAFLTGRFAWKLGVQYPEVIHGMMTGHIPVDEKTFAEITKDMGYDNYYVGRWGVGYASWDFTPLGRGWDKFTGYFGPEGGYYNHTTDHFNEWLGVYDMWDMQEPYIEANMTYSEDLFLNRTIEYLEEAANSGKPFTITYAAQTAHAPIDDDWPTFYPPIVWEECEEEDSTYLGREYYCNKVKYLDYTWGVLMDYLKATGMWDKMLVFVTSDNGALPYTEDDLYSDWGCNWPLRGGKVTHYEGGIKVWAGMTGGLVPNDNQGTTFDSLVHITDFAATAMRLSMTQTKYDERETLTGTDKVVDGKNLFSLEHHELIVHNVKPHYIPSWMREASFDYATTDGEWKYLLGLADEAAQTNGWYNFPGFGVINEWNDYATYSRAGANCTHGCLFHLETDPYEYHDLSSEYQEIVDYFSDLINAIYNGGFDYSYHSGQPYEEDYRGWMEDNILRPYLNGAAIDEYNKRSQSTDSDGSYDYANAELSWTSDYQNENPFGTDAFPSQFHGLPPK